MKNLHRKDNEAFAIGKNVRVSPRKASIVLDTIRGKRVKDAQNILKFSKRAIAQDIYKILSSAAANAENNHQLDLDVLQISEAYCDTLLPSFPGVDRVGDGGAWFCCCCCIG